MARRNSTPRPPKPPQRPERQAAFGLGISAESRAVTWLIAHGYRILARCWKSRSAKSTSSRHADTR
jgi:putative endonuclease